MSDETTKDVVQTTEEEQASTPDVLRWDWDGGRGPTVRSMGKVHQLLLIAITLTATNGSINGVYECVETNGALTLNPATMSGERTNTRGGQTNPTIAVIVVFWVSLGLRWLVEVSVLNYSSSVIKLIGSRMGITPQGRLMRPLRRASMPVKYNVPAADRPVRRARKPYVHLFVGLLTAPGELCSLPLAEISGPMAIRKQTTVLTGAKSFAAGANQYAMFDGLGGY